MIKEEQRVGKIPDSFLSGFIDGLRSLHPQILLLWKEKTAIKDRRALIRIYQEFQKSRKPRLPQDQRLV
jgi:hypothetical protein